MRTTTPLFIKGIFCGILVGLINYFMWILFIGLLITFEAVADVFSKKYSLSGTYVHWLLAIGAYVVANAFWLMAIRRGSGLARGAVLFSVGSAVVAVLIGLLWYKEHVSTLQLVGIGVGIISIALIALSES